MESLPKLNRFCPKNFIGGIFFLRSRVENLPDVCMTVGEKIALRCQIDCEMATSRESFMEAF